MAKFNKRLFGQEVSPEIQKRIKNLSTGGTKTEADVNIGLTGGDRDLAADAKILEQQLPSFEKYLGDRTPFSRMWCAVNIKEIDKETQEVNDQTSKIRVFTVNEHKENSYSRTKDDDFVPFQSINLSLESLKIAPISQLQKNPLFKPAAGITSVTSKTQGALGAIQSTTVEFVVHNKHDFETIFLPFFLKPGSIVCVDYGWSEKNLTLYDPLSKLENEDTEMSKFDSDIYGKGGFLEENFGKVNTVMGNVVSYEASITPEGSYNCSLEILSRNAGLLDKEISDDNDLRILFTNVFDQILVADISAEAGAEVEVTALNLEELTSDTVGTGAEEINRQIDEINEEFLKGQGIGRYMGKGNNFISQKASRLGIFYSQYVTSAQSALNRNGEGNEAYISLGKFEDLFLNNFVTGLVRSDDVVGEEEDGGISSNSFIADVDNNFENVYDSRGCYIRWDEGLFAIQKEPIEKGDAIPAFVLPNEWWDSYNARTSGRVGASDSESEKILKNLSWLSDAAKEIVPEYEPQLNRELYESEKGGDIPIYPETPIMPIRDLFISVSDITTAFKTKSTVNDALLHICDRINEDSLNIFNIKLSTFGDSKTNICFIDANLLPPQPKEKRLTFDVMGETSIVSNCDLKFVTPKAGLSSMIAISNLKQPTKFTQVELGALNHLNLLNRPDGNKNYFVRSLPYKGDINPNIYESALTLDFDKIEAKFKNPGEETSLNTDSQNKFNKYVEAYKKVSQIPTVIQPDTNSSKTKPKGPSPKTSSGANLILHDTRRDMLIEESRDKLYNRSGRSTISAILPIELDLSVYGNKFLQIGDCYTISYLPEHYKDRTFFQIVGIEDQVSVNGWTTSYTSVMRVDPSTDKFMHNEKEKQEHFVDKEDDPSNDIESNHENLLDQLVNDTFGTKEETLEQRYEKRRQRGMSPREYTSSYGVNKVALLREKIYEYQWYEGPNGEVVKRNTKGQLYYRTTENGERVSVVDSTKFKNVTLKIKGVDLALEQKNPAYPQYRNDMDSEDAEVDAPMFWKINKNYFKKTLDEDLTRYHAFRMNMEQLAKINNVAMMYAIRNGVLQNINFENMTYLFDQDFPPKRDSQNRTIEGDVVIGYHNVFEMTALQEIRANVNKMVVEKVVDAIDTAFTGEISDEREEAFIKVLSETVQPIEHIKEKDGTVGAIITYQGIKIPKPIKFIQFRDENAEHEEDTSGRPINDTGSVVEFISLIPGFHLMAPTDFLLPTTGNRPLKIPKHLIEKSGTSIEEILNDINRLYNEYSRKFRGALQNIKQQKSAPLPTITAPPR